MHCRVLQLCLTINYETPCMKHSVLSSSLWSVHLVPLEQKSIDHSNFSTCAGSFFPSLLGIMRHFVCNTMHFNCIASSLIAVNYPCACSALLLEPTTWLLELLHTMAAAKSFLLWTPGFIKSLVSYHLLTLYSLSSHSTYCVPWQIPKKTQEECGWP